MTLDPTIAGRDEPAGEAPTLGGAAAALDDARARLVRTLAALHAAALPGLGPGFDRVIRLAWFRRGGPVRLVQAWRAPATPHVWTGPGPVRCSACGVARTRDNRARLCPVRVDAHRPR